MLCLKNKTKYLFPYNFQTNNVGYFNSVKFAKLETQLQSKKRVSMGLTDRRKTAKNLVESRKN